MRRFLSFFFKLVGFFTVLLAIFAAVLLFFGGRWLPVEGIPQPADYIVVMGGSPSRALYAADLYKRDMAPQVLVSNQWRAPMMQELDKLGVEYCPGEELDTAILRAKGVPQNAISQFGNRNMSTAQEAMELQKRFAGQSVSLLVVTSTYHVRRTGLILDEYMPCCEHLVVGSPYEPFASDWWNDRESARALVLESAKYLYFLFGGRFVSTPPPAEESQETP